MKSTSATSNPATLGNLAHTIGRNTVFGVIARFAQVSTRLVTIPIVIAHLGLGGYGIWSIIMTTAAYMRFGSVGIKSAFQKYVAEATGNGDYETANKLLSTGCAVMLALSVAVLIPVAWFSTALARAAGVPPEFLHSAAQSTSVLALIMVLSNVGAVYEAIVMGGHRIDLARNYATFFTVAEAVAIVILLHFGYGLFAMASVMAASEVGFVLCCYVSSKKIVPQVHVARAYITKKAIPELVRFAGSYQLVNVLEVLYASILPVAILRVFGADSAGIYAIAIRLVSSAVLLSDSFLVPILSGGAMVYASGAQDEMRKLIGKSFKITLGLCLFPLAFIALFGPTMIFAWTGQTASSLRVALWMVCAAGFFQAFSVLGLVLYRVSGNALLDNIRQALRIVCLLSIAGFARHLGFYWVLAGLALTEFAGMMFMLYAITKTFRAFHPRSLLPDAVKLTLASAIVLGAGAIATRIPLPVIANVRWMAVLDLGKVLLACLAATWPALVLTKSVTGAESRALISIVRPRKMRAEQPYAESVT
ncbi:MAG: lipopolysaccharide biosynthesis protein [Candidatus Sulfotelmatobacter sp.]|jgi:O-antigen/teichoic acid export membrane protein